MDARYASDLLRFKYINKYLKGNEILDIGSAEGHLHQLIIKSNPDKKIYTLDNLPSADFVINLDNPKKLGKKFDTVIAGEIIEHLEDPIKFVKFCKTILKKGGRLIITTPNAIGLQYLRSEAWCVYYKNYRGHTQAFTIEMLKRILRDEGFSLIKTDYINAFWINNPLKYISLCIKKIRPDLLIVGDI